MNIKICDSLMGTGKTSACINMMNSTKDKKFIFVTEYLDEVNRIKEACRGNDFMSPQPNITNRFTKLNDSTQLIKEGRNIATTHALFLSFTDEIKELIRDQHYVLVLDEVVNILQVAKVFSNDIKILQRGEVLEEGEDGVYRWTLDDYLEGDETRFESKFADEMILAKSKSFFKFEDSMYVWAIPPELFECFEEVYVLTYLFYGQTLKYFFDMHGLQYEYIGTKIVDGEYRFCDLQECDRAVDLRNKIHILDNAKLNQIGERPGSLSFTWYDNAKKEKDHPKLKSLKNNIYNVFHNIYKCSAEENMWSTYKSHYGALRSKGCGNSFLTYNKRASNDYRDKKYLGYCVNIYPRPWETRYYSEHGVTVDQNLYALSIMVQWIFRSAIRKGEEIWIYIPSLRMRTLLVEWLNRLADGNDLESWDNFKVPKKSKRREGRTDASKNGNKN